MPGQRVLARSKSHQLLLDCERFHYNSRPKQIRNISLLQFRYFFGGDIISELPYPAAAKEIFTAASSD